MLSRILLSIALGLLLLQPLHAARIKDLATLSGVRSNQLVGYGLVVGLNGTGDQVTQTPFTEQSLRNMLRDLGVNVPAGVRLQPKNVAAVAVHADLPPFTRPGQTIDVSVASIGNSNSLNGGSLLMTPLKGADGQTYAMAQGSVLVGISAAAGDDAVTVGVPSAGRIPAGATVEREVRNSFQSGRPLVFNLHNPDFTTAQRIAEAINRELGDNTAQALDPNAVQVRSPQIASQRVGYVSYLENIAVTPAMPPARVIVNSRTGTVIIGQNVKVGPAAVTHGTLSVTIDANPIISQPNAFAGGQTAVVPNNDIEISEEANPMFLFDAGVDLRDIVTAVNRIGATPSDLVSILQALKAAGALGAELIII